MKNLLIVHHSKTGNTRQLIDSVCQGVAGTKTSALSLRHLSAREAGPDDLLWAHGLIIGTPENFGYMAGALKDFWDRTFYEVEGRLAPLPYALVVSAGNDGTGAARSITRIANGYPLVPVQEPIICRGAPTPEHLQSCHDLGAAMAAGIEMGIF